MRILQVYNQYSSSVAGEEKVVHSITDVMKNRGAEVDLWMRTSRGIEDSVSKKLGAFCSGIFSISAYKEMLNRINKFHPDVVHVHNLYPLFSPSVLVACKKMNIPVVMHIHNYGLTCPNWSHFRKEKICMKCYGGKEHWCFIHNCAGDIYKSMGYTTRNIVARKLRLFHNNVTLFTGLSGFAKNHFINAGFRKDRMILLPSMVNIPQAGNGAFQGEYIGYVGRMDVTKGVDTIIEAAKLVRLPIKLAGDGPQLFSLKKNSSENAQFVGVLKHDQLAEFYKRARFIIVASKWFEMYPNVILEAMSYALPVITTNIGVMPEIVKNDTTGLLFDPGSASDLARKMEFLWANPALCDRMGKKGRQIVLMENSEEVFYHRLMSVYERAIAISASAA